MHDRATFASYNVAWMLTKKKKPFVDAGLVKDVAKQLLDDVIGDPKIKASVKQAISQVRMS